MPNTEQAASQADPSTKPAKTAADNLLTEASLTSKLVSMEKAPISPQGKSGKSTTSISS